MPGNAGIASTGWWITLATIAAYLWGLWVVLDVLRRRKEPMAMLSWILGTLLLPYATAPLYFLIGERRVQRRVKKKRKRNADISQAMASVRAGDAEGEAAQAVAAMPGLGESLEELVKISRKLGDFPLTAGNKVDVFTTPQETYEAILEAIRGARQHVHVEYYIFRSDETGRMILETLTTKAREGVEVRVLLDGVGSWTTRNSFFRPMIEAGGRLETFLPAIPWRRAWHLNCRNHRKLVVVDGKVAFTGSQNIGDEYRGRWRRVGPWKDTHLRIEGPAVREVQEVFVEDWYFASGENLTALKYLRRAAPVGPSLVQIVPTGPDQEGGILSQIYFAAISLARKSIRISTPYFVPEPGLVLALQNASYRGVNVEILIPSRTDNRVVLWAGRSFYQELLMAGVRIHEFSHGMLHSKVVSIDDRWTLISSANMDVRSFLLNFEVTASIFDEAIARELLEEFRAHQGVSQEIVRSQPPGPLVAGLLEGAARILSPLL